MRSRGKRGRVKRGRVKRWGIKVALLSAVEFKEHEVEDRERSTDPWKYTGAIPDARFQDLAPGRDDLRIVVIL